MRLGEALLLLQDGEKIRCRGWGCSHFIELAANDKIISSKGEWVNDTDVGFWMSRDDWEVYKEVTKSHEGKGPPIDEEVRRATTLNRLYTDMDVYRKYSREVKKDVEEVARLNGWCYAVENVLGGMGIGVISS